MDKRKLLSIIKRDEGPKLDFKQRIEIEIESGRKELAKDVCAIANSKGGRGYLVIGIEDKSKRIVGIGDLRINEEQIQQIVSSRCEPPIPISYETIEIDGRVIGVITIYDGEQKPYQLRENGAFYIRRGSTTDTMRKQELVSAFQENFTLNIELCPIIKSRLGCIDYKIVDKYFNLKNIAVNEDNRVTLMENASIVTLDKESNEYVGTLGGVLVFSALNNVYISQNMIRIVNKIDNSLDEIILVQGDLLSMIDSCEVILNKILPNNYPINAVIEGVNNAVLYRDYSIYYKEIEIVIDFNSISVISPGSLINSRDVSSHNYLKRNMWIYEKLITLDDKKRFVKSGRGFSRMKRAFRNCGKVLFINSVKDDIFKVIYPGIKYFK